MGPLFFAIAWQGVVEQVARIDGLQWTSFYLDDGHLVGSLSALGQAMELLRREGPALGIQVNT